MRKLNKLKLKNDILTNEELKQLKGGGNNNTNKVENCKCTYYDAPSISNKNTVGGCSCECVGY